MMDTIIKAPRRFTLYGAVLAMAAVVITLLAVAYATGPAQAQSTDGGTGGGNTDDGVNLATYPDPQPCGPGAGTAFQPEPHEVRTGHFAFFDAYWRITGRSVEGDSPDIGVLYINECPPKMVTQKRRDGTTVTTRKVSNIDIEEAIMHVLDKHKEDVVATNAEATAGQLSLEEYPAVRKGLGLEEGDPVPAGTQVWWLRLDDPDTTTGANKDETSDLGIGFSTALFDGDYWHRPGMDANGNPHKAMRWKLEAESYPGDPTNSADVLHFFTYKAPKAGNARAELVWDGFRPGDEATDMVMDPGEYEALQWVFTKPGTYELLVELQGHVRDTDNKPDGAGQDWKPISSNDTETRTATYTFHVGDKLAETEPPIFGVNRSVSENSPGGVKVGDPIPVYNADAVTLYYDLEGDGKENFKTVAGTNPHTVQIVVADGASLDFETRPSYDLELTVTDKLNHEGDKDSPEPVIDDTMIVRISLEDQEPGLKIRADRESLPVGETVNFTAWFEPTPERRGQTPAYLWGEGFHPANHRTLWHILSLPDAGPTWSIPQSSATTKTYRAAVEWANSNTPSMLPTFVFSNEITITWGN